MTENGTECENKKPEWTCDDAFSNSSHVSYSSKTRLEKGLPKLFSGYTADKMKKKKKHKKSKRKHKKLRKKHKISKRKRILSCSDDDSDSSFRDKILKSSKNHLKRKWLSDDDEDEVDSSNSVGVKNLRFEDCCNFELDNVPVLDTLAIPASADDMPLQKSEAHVIQVYPFTHTFFPVLTPSDSESPVGSLVDGVITPTKTVWDPHNGCWTTSTFTLGSPTWDSIHGRASPLGVCETYCEVPTMKLSQDVFCREKLTADSFDCAEPDPTVVRRCVTPTRQLFSAETLVNSNLSLKEKKSRWDLTPEHGGVGDSGDQVTSTNASPSWPEKDDGFARHTLIKQNKFLCDHDASLRQVEVTSLVIQDSPIPMSIDSESDVGQILEAVPINLQPDGDLPPLKPEDVQFFGKLLESGPSERLSHSEWKNRKLMEVLLKIKNGSFTQVNEGLTEIKQRAKMFEAGPLLRNLLSLLVTPSIQNEEYYVMMEALDRVVYKLARTIRPYLPKTLVVVQSMLNDEYSLAQHKAKCIIGKLTKVCGLKSMIICLQPDLDNKDVFVRRVTAQTLAVVAETVGIPQILPFLKEVCQDKRSWLTRQTGIRTVELICLGNKSELKPHVQKLIEAITPGLDDKYFKVRVSTASAVASLAEVSSSSDEAAFYDLLRPLWRELQRSRGKLLTSVIKAIGFIIPLLDADYATYYFTELIPILVREFQSPDGDMKKTLLKVMQKCCGMRCIPLKKLEGNIVQPFFKHIWTPKYALDKQINKQLKYTTQTLAKRIGVCNIISYIVDGLQGEKSGDSYKNMVGETIGSIVNKYGVESIDADMERQITEEFQMAIKLQTTQDVTLLKSFFKVIKAFGNRMLQYKSEIRKSLIVNIACRPMKWKQLVSQIMLELDQTAVL